MKKNTPQTSQGGQGHELFKYAPPPKIRYENMYYNNFHNSIIHTRRSITSCMHPKTNMTCQYYITPPTDRYNALYIKNRTDAVM